MAKVTEYPRITKMKDNDILLVDGPDGTRTILQTDASKQMGGEVIMVNENAGDSTKVVITTTDEEIQLATMADLEPVEEEVSDLKTQISKYTGNAELLVTNDGIYNLNNSPVSLTPISTTGYKCGYFDCVYGSKFVITGNSNGVAARLYAFLDVDNNILESVAAGYSANELLITAPYGTRKLVVNDYQNTLKLTQGDYLVDEVKNLENRINYVTNIIEYKIKEYTNLYDGTNVIKTNNAMTSAIIPLKRGVTYNIKANGEYFNRFIISGCDDPEVTKPCTRIYTDTLGAKTEASYKYIDDGSYKYLLVLVNYETNSSTAYNAELSYTESVGNQEEFRVNGVEVLTAEQTEIVAKQTADESAKEVTNGTYEKELDYIEDVFVINHGAISSAYTGNSVYTEISNGNKYSVSVVGTFNRFVVALTNSVEIGSPVDVLINNSPGSETKREYSFNNASDYKYLIIYYNIASGATGSIADATVNILEAHSTDNFTVNGVRVYTEKEINDLLSNNSDYLFYTSKKSITLPTQSSEVFGMYDELLAEYPDYITKSTLGIDSYNKSIYAYQFGGGSYNNEGQRPRDTSTDKPTILLVAGVHGYERSAVMSTYQFISDLCEGNNRLCKLRENYIIKMIPIVCPGEYDANTRTNNNGVNINRNFDANWQYGGVGTNDFSGNAAADQPETQIVQDFMDDNSDAIIFIDHHNSGYIDEVSYLSGKNSIDKTTDIKDNFLKNGYALIPYFVNEEGFSNDLIYAYTGYFDIGGMSPEYAYKINMRGVCLETSWNQDNTGKDSSTTLRASATVLGNLLNGIIESLT